MKKLTQLELGELNNQYRLWLSEAIHYNGWYEFIEDYIGWLIADPQRQSDVCKTWIKFKGTVKASYIDNPHMQFENVEAFLKRQNKTAQTICSFLQ